MLHDLIVALSVIGAFAFTYAFLALCERLAVRGR